VYEVVFGEFVRWILHELDKGDQEAPRMRTVHDDSLEEHTSDLLLYGFRVRLGEQIQQSAAEIVRVTVRETQLISDSVQKYVSENDSK
jgi:hypothetical protein